MSHSLILVQIQDFSCAVHSVALKIHVWLL